MLAVVRTEQAEADLAEILTYLEEHSPAAAERLANTLAERCPQIARLPGIGRNRDELAPGIRSVVIEKYVVFFRVAGGAVRVLRVLHGARDIGSWMLEE